MKVSKLLISTLLAFFIVLPAGAAQPPGQHLNITQVLVDNSADPTTFMIVGTDLDFGNGPLVVTLGDAGPLTIISSDDTLIEAAFPGGVPDGDYLLTVAMGKGQSQNDEYDLTIGAVGPQGDQGIQGKLGDTGDQGIQGKLGDTGDQGIQGKLGDTGDQGIQGKLGDTGDQGVQGKLGAQGVQGKLGDQGVQGKLGDQGVQGKVGPQGEPGETGPTDPDQQLIKDTLCWLAELNGQPLPTFCPPPTNLVFISSELYDGNLGGVAGADATCQTLAFDAGLPGTYKAWISGASGGPATSFVQSSDPYVMVNGTQLAANWSDLTDGSNPTLNVTESGVVGGPGRIWTGTEIDGTSVGGVGQWSCGWATSNSLSDYGLSGSQGAFTGQWTRHLNLTCDTPAHIYCFEQ